MKLREDLQKIIDDAPLGATHYCRQENLYWDFALSNDHPVVYMERSDFDKSLKRFPTDDKPEPIEILQLSEIKHQLELQVEIERLQGENSELKDKIGEAKDDVYSKRAHMLTEFGIDGSTCKRVYAWLDTIFN